MKRKFTLGVILFLAVFALGVGLAPALVTTASAGPGPPQACCQGQGPCYAEMGCYCRPCGGYYPCNKCCYCE